MWHDGKMQEDTTLVCLKRGAVHRPSPQFQRLQADRGERQGRQRVGRGARHSRMRYHRSRLGPPEQAAASGVTVPVAVAVTATRFDLSAFLSKCVIYVHIQTHGKIRSINARMGHGSHMDQNGSGRREQMDQV